jgi:hypothetical protein
MRANASASGVAVGAQGNGILIKKVPLWFGNCTTSNFLQIYFFTSNMVAIKN